MSSRVTKWLALLSQVPGALLADAEFRSALSAELGASRFRRHKRSDALDADWRDLLVPGSAAFGRIRAVPAPPAVNLLVGSVHPRRIYAGVETALAVAARLAQLVGAHVRVLTTEDVPPPGIAEQLGRRHGASFQVLPSTAAAVTEFGTHDAWVATHFTTAFAMQVATTAGTIDPDRVVYLVQDYEPGFVPWSSDSELARATYHAGFRLVVNSEPVAQYLRQHENLVIPAERVFAPRLQVEILHQIARMRERRPPRRLAFYGRPSRPRNMYQLGVAALRHAIDLLGVDAVNVDFVSMGGVTGPVSLGRRVTMRPVGKLAWEDYLQLLADVDVVVSLQQSPHPSHPPLEAALAGATAITNDFDGTRGRLHPGLIAVTASPEGLGETIAMRLREPAAGVVSGISGLGRPLDLVLAYVASELWPQG